ncbi:hypothetical protein GCM10018953_24240 [Streptosporangium nondiastaticum]|uniref:hypothetical protein n=1 Tax=Streptosporangium nondiastaticum TaxID=35764 RepID=UPI0031F8D5E8
MDISKKTHMIKTSCYDFSVRGDQPVARVKQIIETLDGESIKNAGTAYLDACSLLAECQRAVENVSKTLAECWNDKASVEAQTALRYIHATARELSNKGNMMGRPLESLGDALPAYKETGEGGFAPSWSENTFTFNDDVSDFYDTKDGVQWGSQNQLAKEHLEKLNAEIQKWHTLLPDSLRKELPRIEPPTVPTPPFPTVDYPGGYPSAGPYGPGGTGPYGAGPYGNGPDGTGPYGTDPFATDPFATDPNGTGPNGTGPNGTDPDGSGDLPPGAYPGDGGTGLPGQNGPGAGMPGGAGGNGTDPTGGLTDPSKGLTDPSGNLTDPSRNLTYPAGYDAGNARTTDLSSFQPPQGYDGIGNPNPNNPNLSGLNTSTGTSPYASPTYTGSPTNTGTGTGTGTGGIGSSGSFGTAGVRAAALNAAEGAAGSGMFMPPMGAMGGAGAGAGEQEQESGSNLWEHDDVWGANDHEGAVDGHIGSV